MPRLTFSWAGLHCAVVYLSVNCRTLGHENHGAQWFWQTPLHLTSKAKDMWPLVHFTFIVSNMSILKYIIFPFREGGGWGEVEDGGWGKVGGQLGELSQVREA